MNRTQHQLFFTMTTFVGHKDQLAIISSVNRQSISKNLSFPSILQTLELKEWGFWVSFAKSRGKREKCEFSWCKNLFYNSILIATGKCLLINWI